MLKKHKIGDWSGKNVQSHGKDLIKNYLGMVIKNRFTSAITVLSGCMFYSF